MILDKESEDYIKEVIQDFQTTSNHSRYHHVIKAPIVKKDLPPVFIWSPLQSSNIDFVCPYHSVSPYHPYHLVTPWSVKNPRLVYVSSQIFYLFSSITIAMKKIIPIIDFHHQMREYWPSFQRMHWPSFTWWNTTVVYFLVSWLIMYSTRLLEA